MTSSDEGGSGRLHAAPWCNYRWRPAPLRRTVQCCRPFPRRKPDWLEREGCPWPRWRCLRLSGLRADDGGLCHQVAFAGGQRSGGRCSLAARPFAFLGGSGVRECHTSGVGQHPHMAAGDMGINRPGRDGPGLGNEARQDEIFIRAVKRVENRPNLIVRVVAEFVPLRRVNRRRRSNGYGLGHVSLDGLECPPLQRPDRTDGLAQDNRDLLDCDTPHDAKQENISLIGNKTFESGDDPLLSESIHHNQCWTLRRS